MFLWLKNEIFGRFTNKYNIYELYIVCFLYICITNSFKL